MSLSTFTLFANLPKELQVHIWEIASTTDDTAHLHESFLYAALVHRIRPMEEASIYPSFLISISRYRARYGGYWASWMALRGACHLSRQLVLKQLLSLIRSICFKDFVWSAVHGEEVKRKLMDQIEEFIDGG